MSRPPQFSGEQSLGYLASFAATLPDEQLPELALARRALARTIGEPGDIDAILLNQAKVLLGGGSVDRVISRFAAAGVPLNDEQRAQLRRPIPPTAKGSLSQYSQRLAEERHHHQAAQFAAGPEVKRVSELIKAIDDTGKK